MAITQTITTIPEAGHRGIDARDTFVEKQEAFQDALTNTFVAEINAFKTQANDLETNVNAKEASAVTTRDEAVQARDEAVQARDEAVGAVATLPDGIINDGTVSATDTWSSQKIDNEKQDTLTSGTNIKTINSVSLLGSGNIVTPTTTVNNTLTSTSTTEALSAAQGKALEDGKVSKSGSTLTGALTAIRETKIAMAANNVDLSLGNLFTKTISGATSLTVSNALSTGNANSFILELTNGGSATITWFSGTKWAGGTAPVLTTSGVDILGFYSHDGGTTWRGMLLAKDSK